ncbi:unnamed protein product [Medioppia subpectinata]|uniref:Uncharacterized protein n=1 Tax=Medioppia subpectinata TaxID=1979941 RepID=A0A7R9PXV0_9ACAR|nr:unnamed protein product [Medioppia subpectinata]CAG2104767.1 unnamed protein product [Medioppia subpectinata]
MKCSVLVALALCLTAQVAYGASIEKRGIIGNFLHLLDMFNYRGQCQQKPPVATGPSVTGATPTTMKVDLDQLLQADCRHPVSVDYKQTVRRLEVDLKEFGPSDPTKPNHLEYLLAFTPFVNTTVTVNKHMKCVSNGVNKLTGIALNAVSHPMELSCSGFHFRQIPYIFNAYFNGLGEDLTVENCNQVVSSVNGNMFELNLGPITSGRCKGDLLYVQTVYTSDNPLACAEYSLNTLRVTHMSASIYGDKCQTTCSLDSASPVTLDTAINNQGKA